MAEAASASTDGGGRDGQEQEHSSGGLDHREDVASGAKISGKFLKILDGKKTSLRNTCKCQMEANDKVWSLNQETEKALE